MKQSPLTLLLIALVSVTTSQLFASSPASQSEYLPKEDKALIIFMRPSMLGAAIKSPLLDITNESPQVIGNFGAKKKIAYYCEPGERRFMSMGENVDFMDANLLAGKTYYVQVIPKMGALKARFILKPYKKNSGDPEFRHGSEKFQKAWDKCKFIETDAKDEKWAKNKAAKIAKRKANYTIKWEAMEEGEREWLSIAKNDGV